MFYRVQVREHLTRDQRPFLHPDLQIHSFSSSVHLTHLLQRSGQRTPDTRSETIPSSRISPDSSDSQLLLFSSPHSSSTGFRSENTWPEIRDHSFIQNHSRSFRFTASSLQFINLLQGSGQRTPDQRSETIPSSRITPDSSDSQLLLFSSPHSSSTGFRSENTGHKIRDHSDSQLLLFSSPHSCSTGFRSENTWPEIRDHSFIQNHSRPIRFTASSLLFTPLLQGSGQRTPDQRSETIPSSRITPDSSDSQLLLFSSPHSSSTGFRSENTWPEIRDHSFIQNLSRSFRFTASPLQFTSLIFYRVQVREHLTRDQRPFLHPESLQNLQIHSFFSSVHLTHVLQGLSQRTPDQRSETIPSSRITPDSSDSQLLLFSSPHSSSTGFRSENTGHKIRDHSFIQNLSRLFRFTASSLQFTSLMFYRLQVREHLTRDQRSFLHPEPFQTHQIHSFFSSVHSSSTGFRSENTWHEIRDHSFIQNHSRSSDSQLLLFSSPHSSSTGFRSENTCPEIRDHSFIQNLSRSFRFTASPLQFTSLIFYRVQVREHLTRDQRPFLHPESLQTRQIHSFSSSVHSLMIYRVQVR